MENFKYKVKDFKVTKDDLFYENKVDLPEKQTLSVIQEWCDWACKQSGINQAGSDHWKNYSKIYLAQVVNKSRVWPIYLPIGYVFSSFILSTGIEIVKLEDHRNTFDYWIGVEHIRTGMFDRFDKKEFFVHKSPQTDDFLNGSDLAEALYSTKTEKQLSIL